MSELEKKCFGWKGITGLGETSFFLSCAQYPGWKVNPIYTGGYCYPTDNGINLASESYGAIPTQIIALKNQAEIDNWLNGAAASGSGCTSCLGDCPEGSHKCTHNKYPGYCCVPCKETGERLQNIANKVGR
ncbi:MULTISPECIES: hypothetical protein [unclassified Nostoc]|uniref:hypothetical protein n=1 Tax=unclassified Nostoc TaxID=2593658 RepID=UPI002AD2D384|nr:hypothetical protein [Nostoc sp. DedQUE03]MDZ7977215.1 hypothetical protein [Nostoc sp. DedQUE03]MDZ8047664.1 hypothetical protein [Nostoc sp. DedQUE02]